MLGPCTHRPLPAPWAGTLRLEHGAGALYPVPVPCIWDPVPMTSTSALYLVQVSCSWYPLPCSKALVPPTPCLVLVPRCRCWHPVPGAAASCQCPVPTVQCLVPVLGADAGAPCIAPGPSVLGA